MKPSSILLLRIFKLIQEAEAYLTDVEESKIGGTDDMQEQSISNFQVLINFYAIFGIYFPHSHSFVEIFTLSTSKCIKVSTS